MEILSLLIGIAILILLSYKGVETFLSAMIACVAVLLLSGMNVWTGMSEAFANGFISFIGSYVLLITISAMFSSLISVSGCAKSFALKMLEVFGEKRIIAVLMVTAVIMCFCGINIYVIFYAVYPIAVVIGKRQNIHKGVLACAIFTIVFTVAFPGTISLPNIIGSNVLGTPLTAGWQIGIVGNLVELGLCIAITYYISTKYKKKGLGFEPGPQDHLYLAENIKDDDLPHWAISLLPLVLVAGLGLGLSFYYDAVFAVVIALLASSLVVIALNFKRLRSDLAKTVGSGLMNGFGPLISISALVGFGSVVQGTAGFAQVTDFAVNLNMHPYMGIFVSTNLLVGVTGSMSGGLNIFMQTLAPEYLAMGVNPEIIHRLAAMASTGLDSLPHSAGIIGQLAVMQLTVKQGYKYAFTHTVLVPIVGAFVAVVLAMLFF